MIKNASAGEYIFFTDFDPKKAKPRKAHAFVSRKDREVYPYEHVIHEEDLNSLARVKKNVWIEGDFAFHESKYMRDNSKGRSFYKK
jgi:hypothetical protein